MKTFNVKGGNWSMLIDIDETVYEKYGDMAKESMSRAFDSFIRGELNDFGLLGNSSTHPDDHEELSVGLVMTSCEKGFEDDPDKEIACLSHFVAENAGYHEAAKEMREEMIKYHNQLDNLE